MMVAMKRGRMVVPASPPTTGARMTVLQGRGERGGEERVEEGHGLGERDRERDR